MIDIWTTRYQDFLLEKMLEYLLVGGWVSFGRRTTTSCDRGGLQLRGEAASIKCGGVRFKGENVNTLYLIKG